jgi:NAD(P)-dependent dehydrogenase (short-subunit alcohol dehydrogenase family)
MQRFEGRSVFVTGGAHGIGRATALRLASEGASVSLADRDVPAAEGVAREIGDNAQVAVCDVLSSESVQAAIAAHVARFGGLDALVCTAGGYPPDFKGTEDDEVEWNRLIDLNLNSVGRCVRAALPHLEASKFGGNVVMISSVNGIAAFGGYAYSAAKAGLQNYVLNLTAEYGRRGMRFNVVAPGTIRTRVWDNQQGVLENFVKYYPLRRIGEPTDIAAAVAFLASDDAAWVSGITLPVDGGILSGPRAVLRGLDPES